MCTCGCGPTEHHDHAHQPAHDHGAHGHGHEHFHRHEGGNSHHHHDEATGRTIAIEIDILAKNDHLAAGNRAFFQEKGIFVLNLVSSPGSGKTAILERTLRDLKEKISFAVIEGDQQTDNDAVRISATGAPVHQVNTGAGCHLDAHMVCHAMDHFHMDAVDILMIENVGNLVCPASFDLGEHHKVVVLSVTEGEDKPLKYPTMFHNSDVMLLNKIDLLPHVDFDAEKCKASARRINPGILIFEVSIKTGEGMDAWYEWLAAACRK